MPARQVPLTTQSRPSLTDEQLGDPRSGCNGVIRCRYNTCQLGDALLVTSSWKINMTTNILPAAIAAWNARIGNVLIVWPGNPSRRSIHPGVHCNGTAGGVLRQVCWGILSGHDA